MADELLKGLHVAVTRPLGQSAKLVDSILYHGGKAISFPLIAISPLDDYQEFDLAIAKLEMTDWAIFISTNAVNNALPRVLKKFGSVPKNLKFAAIGYQTAKELALYEVHNVLTPQTRFDSESLLSLSEMQNVANQKILIFRGVGGREILAQTLKSRGANINFAECYYRTNPQADTKLLISAWNQNQLDAIVVTSSEAMRNLLNISNLLKKNKEAEWIRHTTLCVNHARIAELPLQLGLKVLVADTPGDDAMIKCLSQLVKTQG